MLYKAKMADIQVVEKERTPKLCPWGLWLPAESCRDRCKMTIENLEISLRKGLRYRHLAARNGYRTKSPNIISQSWSKFWLKNMHYYQGDIKELDLLMNDMISTDFISFHKVSFCLKNKLSQVPTKLNQSIIDLSHLCLVLLSNKTTENPTEFRLPTYLECFLLFWYLMKFLTWNVWSSNP